MKANTKPLIAAVLCGACFTAQAEVSATLDRDRVGVGDTVQLSLQRDSRGGDAPDLSALKSDFDVVGTSSGSNVQIVNGHISQQSVLRIGLIPRHAGALSIPALNWGGETTTPLSLTVTGDASGGAADGSAAVASQHIFVTTTLDQKRPYVQGNAVLTVTIHSDVPVRRASLDFEGSNHAVVQQLGKDEQDAEIRNGRRFQILRRRYLLQMQRSGTITLPGPTLDAQVEQPGSQDPFADTSVFGQVFGGMMGSLQQVRRHGDDIRLEVRPRPAAATSINWLPAEKLSVDESWHPDTDKLKAGEPLMLHLHLRAEGLTATQLPDLSTQLGLPDGIKAYPDQAKLDTSVQAGTLVGSRDQDVALIAAQSGRYRIPPLRLSWWDIDRDAPQEIVLPARDIDVSAAPGSAQAATATPATPDSASPNDTAPAIALSPDPARAPARSFWPWISLALGLLWIGTLALWWRQRRGVSRRVQEPVAGSAIVDDAGIRESRQRFQQACRDNDPLKARKSLLAWARASWGTSAPAGLNALAKRLGKEPIGRLLQELDRACYSASPWKGDALVQALTSLAAPERKATAKSALAGLYDPGAS